MLLTPFKFGTIGLFLISGFLLGDRVGRSNPMGYFMRRVKRILVPWAFWFGIMCALLVSHKIVNDPFGNFAKGRIQGILWSTVRSTIWDFHILVCAKSDPLHCYLLIFRNYLNSLMLGAVLLAANTVYVANVYARWFTTLHTHAMFGFVFYLWLGSYAAQKFETFSPCLTRVSSLALAILTVVTGIASSCEASLLSSLGRSDSLNTLRLSNQLFSVCTVLAIFKLARATWPRFVAVRRNTFGIYLTHVIVLKSCMFLLRRAHLTVAGSAFMADLEGILFWITLSVFVYLSCLVVAQCLAGEPSLQWTVGLASQTNGSGGTVS